MKNNIAVIVTYNRLNLLKECIDAALNQTYPFSEIIVVDNCSNDGTAEYLDEKKEQTPELTVIHQDENLGGAGGFYEALKVAQTRDLDYVLIIDDDAILQNDYMENIMVYADKHVEEDAQAFAGKVVTDGKIDISHRRRLGNKYIFNEPFVQEEEYKKEAFPCRFATFCGLVIRGDVFHRIGLPKREYFIWYDDTEYCLRLEGITVIPSAVLNHKTILPTEDKGLLDRPNWKYYYGYRNRYDTSRVHFGRFPAMTIALEYHILRFCSRLMILNPKKHEQGVFNVRMMGHALKDAKRGKLGKHPEYGPWAN